MSSTKDEKLCVLFRDMKKRHRLWNDINDKYSENLKSLRDKNGSAQEEVTLIERWISDLKDQNKMLFEIVQYFGKEAAMKIHKIFSDAEKYNFSSSKMENMNSNACGCIPENSDMTLSDLYEKFEKSIISKNEELFKLESIHTFAMERFKILQLQTVMKNEILYKMKKIAFET